jgi:hypothetical protein
MASEYEVVIYHYGQETRRISGLTKAGAKAVFARESEPHNQYAQLVVNGEPKLYWEAEKLLELDKEFSRRQFKMDRAWKRADGKTAQRSWYERHKNDPEFKAKERERSRKNYAKYKLLRDQEGMRANESNG